MKGFQRVERAKEPLCSIIKVVQINSFNAFQISLASGMRGCFLQRKCVAKRLIGETEFQAMIPTCY